MPWVIGLYWGSWGGGGGGGGGGYRGLLNVCVYNKIAEDKSFSIMIIVPDAAVSTSVRTTPELHTK